MGRVEGTLKEIAILSDTLLNDDTTGDGERLWFLT